MRSVRTKPTAGRNENQFMWKRIERGYLKLQLTTAEIARMRTNVTAVTGTDKVDSSITADFLQQENYIPIPDSILSVVKVFPLTDKITQKI